jgi:hypothetical protein
VKREREREYYITSKATGEQRRRFEFAALSGEEVLRGREVRHWGLEVPWRVQVITVTQPTSGKEGRVVSIATEGGEGAGKLAKTKPGKKRRIILREKRRKIEKREEAKKKEKGSREEAEREKRTRRNREKKVKRKMKEKALKATGGVVGGGGDETKDIQSGSN